MAVNEKLAKIRKIHHLTQKEVATRLNITDSALSNYECGRRVPSHDFLLKFAKALNLSSEETHDLIFDRDVNDSYDPYITKPFDRQSFIILDAEKLKQLPPSELIKIKEYAEMIYDHYQFSKRRRSKRT